MNPSLFLSGDTFPIWTEKKRESLRGGGVIKTPQRASEKEVCVCVCVQGVVKGWAGVIVLASLCCWMVGLRWWEEECRHNGEVRLVFFSSSCITPFSFFPPHWSTVTVATQPHGQAMHQSFCSSPAMGRDFLNGPSFP